MEECREVVTVTDDGGFREPPTQDGKVLIEAALPEGNRAQHAAAEEMPSAVEAAHAKAAAQLRAAQDDALQAARALPMQACSAAAAASEGWAAEKAELTQQLKAAQDYIQRVLAEKDDMEKRFHGLKDELITRMRNACTQRDEARAQLQKAAAYMVKQQKKTNKAAPADKAKAAEAPPSASTAATAAGSAAGAVADDAHMSPAATATGLCGSKHAHGQLEARVGPGTHMQESELERNTLELELEAKQQQLIQGKRKQETEQLLASLKQRMGFHNGKPVAALVVFRACHHWRAFEADVTSVFDRIIEVIGTQIEQQQVDNDNLAYWLTNTVTPLRVLQHNLKPAGASATVKRVASTAGSSSLGGLHSKQPEAGAKPISGCGGYRLVEAKYPALLFKERVQGLVQKIYQQLQDSMKKTIGPLLGACMYRYDGRADGNHRPVHEQSRAWSDIMAVFDELLVQLRDNWVPKSLVQALFKQLFGFTNTQLFNQLLLRREFCSFSNGEYMEAGLAQGTDWMGESWDELRFIHQAVALLVTGNKPKKTLEGITRDLCPVLPMQQLYRISTMYWDDTGNTESVSTEVLGRMKQAMTDHSSSGTHGFLLDDDSKRPFTVDAIVAQMDDKDLYVALPVPEQLKQAGDGSSSFVFLEKELLFSWM